MAEESWEGICTFVKASFPVSHLYGGNGKRRETRLETGENEKGFLSGKLETGRKRNKETKAVIFASLVSIIGGSSNHEHNQDNSTPTTGPAYETKRRNPADSL